MSNWVVTRISETCKKDDKIFRRWFPFLWLPYDAFPSPWLFLLVGSFISWNDVWGLVVEKKFVCFGEKWQKMTEILVLMTWRSFSTCTRRSTMGNIVDKCSHGNYFCVSCVIRFIRSILPVLLFYNITLTSKWMDTNNSW